MILSFTVDDAFAARVAQGLGAYYNYQATIDGAPNPQTLADFVREKIREEILDKIAQVEARAAAESAREAAITAANQIPITLG